MKEYLIRGRILKAQAQQDGRMCPEQGYEFTQERLRVEVWDRDVRFDDRLASSATGFGVGVFELRFTDENFRLEPGETELEPDVFFKVFHQRQLLFSTEDELLPRKLNSNEDFFKITEEFPPIFEQRSASDQRSKINLVPILTLPPTEINSSKQGYPVGDRCYRVGIIEAFVKEIPDVKEREQAQAISQKDTVVDILPTSEQIVSARQSRAIAPTENRGGSLQQVVNNAFNQVLGHTSRTDDVTKFRNSLNNAFTSKETNGQRTYVWTPRTYTTQTELGGTLTGAQASLYHRAKAALKEILPLLDGLYALDPSGDEQNQEAARAIIRTEIVELVNEMGVHQGPRVQRVDSLFELLIGSADATTLPEQFGGQLRNLTDTFGLNRSRINTVDEERNYSHLLIIRDYMVSLRESWNNYIEDSGSGAYIGTQLVLLSQALSVVAESVRETYQIMDLVFLGAEERQSVWIDFTTANDSQQNDVAFPLPDGTGYSQEKTAQLRHPMDIERLLSWVLRFSTEEGPVLARSGGKLGIVSAIANTAEKLMILVQAASYVPVGNSAFKREGVIRALRDLSFQLYQVQRLAKELIPPIISGQSDDVGDRPLLIPDVRNNTRRVT